PQTAKAPEKTPVALEERRKWLELDQPAATEPQPPNQAERLAARDQKVAQEKAPDAADSRDQQTSQNAAPEPPAPAPAQTPAQQQPRTDKKVQAGKLAPTPPLADLGAEKTRPPEPQPQPEQETQAGIPEQPIYLPSLKDLTSLSPRTLARLDSQEQQRSKKREDIALKDDEIWLNLQQMDNKLLSFFRRFHDRVEAVWNYPVKASSRGIEGTLLIKITINRKGELMDALPLESSGSEILDYEAIMAVYRAAPFGPLPSQYPHEQLKIYAHFQYSLNRRIIYGQP
ncbi:MAG: TonB family protein, partial [Desulfuromonadales bacterium]|nr:TonB family protein [Desulfuromonadales bacterium]